MKNKKEIIKTPDSIADIEETILIINGNEYPVDLIKVPSGFFSVMVPSSIHEDEGQNKSE